MTQSDGILVVKLGAHCHMEKFSQGLLYMNTLKHFVEEETSLLRRDSYEGTSHMVRGEIQVRSDDGPFTRISGVDGPIGFHLQPDILNVNVFCMYAVRESASNTLVDPRNFDFGDTFAILTDFEEFMKRVNAAVPATEQLQSGLVEYIDEDSCQGLVEMGIFRKVSGFSYQNEFRIALLPGTGAVRRFEVGNLSDIVMLGRSSDLNDCLRVQVNAQRRRELRG